MRRKAIGLLVIAAVFCCVGYFLIPLAQINSASAPAHINDSVALSNVSPPQDTSTPSESGADTDQWVQKLVHAWNSVKSMQADIKIYSKTDPSKNGTGSLQYIQDGHAGKYRYDVFLEGVDDTPNHQMTGTAIFDGAVVNLTTSLDNTPHSQTTQPSLMPAPPPGGSLLFELLQRDYRLHATEHDTSGSRVHLTGEPIVPGKRPDTYEQVFLSLDISTGCLHKLEVQMKNGGDMFGIEILPPIFNQPMDETRFIYDLTRVPEGINQNINQR